MFDYTAVQYIRPTGEPGHEARHREAIEGILSAETKKPATSQLVNRPPSDTREAMIVRAARFITFR